MCIWVSIPRRAAEVGHNPCTVWRHIRDGLLPPPTKIGPSTTRLARHELDAIDRARLAGANDDAIRKLVRDLVEARQQQVAA